MRESQAWIYVARFIDEMTDGQGFICCAIEDLADPPGLRYRSKHLPTIPRALADHMEWRVQQHLIGDANAYVLAYGDEKAEFRQRRVLACLWLSLEAQEDELDQETRGLTRLVEAEF